MPTWQYYIGWILVAVNSICLLRLGILPMIFFGRITSYTGKFWVSCFVAMVFLPAK